MRKWLVCVSALCLAGLLAGCGEEETRDQLDWAIDPAETGERREILRKALAIVIAECPALAGIDWEDVARKQGDFSAPYGSSKPVRFYKANSENTPARPYQKILSWPYIDTRERVDWTDGNFEPVEFYEFDPSDVFSRPMIDGWTHHGEFYLKPPGGDAVLPVYLGFSWTAPPGIATEARENPAKDAKKKKCVTLTGSTRGKTGASSGSSGSMPWRRS
jgi:hypothetical protein